MGRISKSLVVALILTITITSLLTVKADPSPPIHFPGGVNLYSPVNQTYNSHYITLNVTIELGAELTLTYKIDNGSYHGQIPLHYQSGGVVIATYNGAVELPYLPSGNHSLTIVEEAKVANRMETWTDNVTFQISEDEPSPTPTSTVPELSWIIIFPLFALMLSLSIKYRYKKGI